ncbi:MAG: hypothetical protein FJ221_12940 [Lentisphaerae bacterium]|nr:hypothetical protein [Lentisphaerota bacterium]
MRYQSEQADALEAYVLRSFSLPATAHHLYSAIRWIERRKDVGLCGRVIAGYRELSDTARIDIGSIKPALLALQERGLIALRIGLPIKGARVATEIRRSTLDEIKARSRAGDDIAARLAAALTGRAFRFHGETISPTWSVCHTGRVISAKPNIQGEPEAKRWNGLAVGLTSGRALVHADIRQAEPTVIKHLLGIPADRDLYAEFMRGAGCDRDAAKKAVNMLAYCRDSLACFRHWPAAAGDSLRDYVEPLAAYKARLLADARRTRTVHTCTGRSIIAGERRRIHAGHVLNWRVQGTVADIVNAACLDILSRTAVLVPVHDAVYAVVSEADVDSVAASMVDEARRHGLGLDARTNVRR